MMGGMGSSRLPLGMAFNVLKLSVVAGDRAAAKLPERLSRIKPIGVDGVPERKIELSMEHMRFLINGLPDGTTTNGSTATSRLFIGADAVVTLLIEYAPGTAQATTATTIIGAPLSTSTIAGTPATTIAGTASTTIAGATGATGATTTTIGAVLPPPVSGRAELVTRFLSAIPATMSGIDLTVTCTPPTNSGAFQTQAVRLGALPATAQLSVVLSPATATAAATACQVEARLVGTDLGSANLRFLLNGQPLTGATTGNFINSPTFGAPQPFTLAIEILFPGLAGATTSTPSAASATSTTVFGATTIPAPTTTVAGNQSIVTLALTRNGTAPGNLDGYFIDLACNNVLVSGNPNGSFSFRSKILASGGTTSVPVIINALSTCAVTVTSIASSGSITTGTVSISTGGVPRASGAGGGASTSPFPIVAGSQTVAISVSY